MTRPISEKITVYGIPNCDTVKKSRVWLTVEGHDFEFHDFKKQGLDLATIENWLKYVPLETLINRKGTTWRSLSDVQKATATDVKTAQLLIISNPSLVKRPVLQIADGKNIKYVSVGFSPDQFQTIFENK